MAPSGARTVRSLKTVNEAEWLAQFGGGGRCVCVCVYRCSEGRLDFFFSLFYYSFFWWEVFLGLGFLSPHHPPPPPHLCFVVIFLFVPIPFSGFVVSPGSCLNSIVMEEGRLCNY